MAACTQSRGQARVLRTALMSSVAVATLVALLPTVPARGEERKFVVWLANVPKSRPNSALPNADDVRAQYFDTIAGNGVKSFAEYWKEISYGQVTISGDVLGWFNLPWPIKPTAGSTAGTTGDLPFTALRRGSFTQGAGEEVNESFQMFKIDGEFVPGLVDGVWTPGERFRDVDGDGEYDSLDEPFGPDTSGQFCPGSVNSFVDLNGDGQRQKAEPFEDFMSRWNGSRWVRVTDAYVLNNYPGSQVTRRMLTSQRQDLDLAGAVFKLADVDAGDDRPRMLQLATPQFVATDKGASIQLFLVDPAVAGAVNNSGVYMIDEVDPGGMWIIVDRDFPLNVGDFINGELSFQTERTITVSADPNQGAHIRPGSSDPTDVDLRNEFVPGFTPQFKDTDQGAFLVIAGSKSGNDGQYVIARGGVLLAGRRVTVEAPGFPFYEGAEDSSNPDRCCWAFPALDDDDDGNVNFIDRNCDLQYQAILPSGLTVKVRARVIINGSEDSNGNGVLDAGEDVNGNGRLDVGARSGNGKYDGPDRWREAGNTKMIQLNGVGLATPRPAWLDDWWTFRYGTAAPAEWPTGIPNLQPFAIVPPSTPPVGDPDPPPDAGRPFEPNAGSADAPEPTGDVQPDATGYYDGPIEFDDLPSSAYHIGGDGRLGEVTSPLNTSIFGQDLVGPNPAVPDGIIPSGGPRAIGVNGTSGHDAGNVLNLELLTRRTDGTSLTQPIGFDPRALAELPPDVLANPRLADPVNFPGFRDWNLDGLVDQGEVRDAGTENYVADAYSGTTFNDGFNSTYPHNRRRIMEDVIAATDASADWDQFVQGGTPRGPGDPATIGNQISGLVLLPADAGVGGLLRLPASSLGDYVKIQTEDSANPFYFSDIMSGLSGGAEGDDAGATASFLTGFAAHEYLHTWEGFPDLYDYDVFQPPPQIINRPVGRWDIMANGGLVHPTPILKAWPSGQRPSGAEPWVEPVDLTTVLVPNVAQTVFLPPSEFRREDVFYTFRNPVFGGNPNSAIAGERFWFWSVADQGFDTTLPGWGVMIMHSDLGDNPEAQPQGQRIEGRSNYLIVQADGLQQLEAGTNGGDAGDPFPGSQGVTTFNVVTDPNNKWYDDNTNAGSGIQITEIQPINGGSGGHNVTFLWTPREVPTLGFIEPPGGEVDGSIYTVRYEVFDLFGGTTIEFFLDTDDGGYDGTRLPGAPAIKPLGLVQGTYDADVTTAPFSGNGTYYFYAKLSPGDGADGNPEQAVSPVRPSNQNLGNGQLLGADGSSPLGRSDVDLTVSKVEVWTVVCTDDTTPGAEVWSVTGTVSGEQAADATTGNVYATDGGEVTFTIVAGTANFAVDDRFLFLTTGLTPYSDPLRIQDGDVVQPPIAVITSTCLSGANAGQSPCSGQSPLAVQFDANASTDFEGNPLFGAVYEWDFGDGATGGGRVVQHTFAPAASYLVTLTVTGRDGGRDTATETIVVDNAAPSAVISACTVAACGLAGSTPIPDPITGTASLPPSDVITVFFDGFGSSDSNQEALTYEWDFGDGSTEGPGGPDEFRSVEHTYSVAFPDVITVSLRVTDPAGASHTDFLTLNFINHAPEITSLTASPQAGDRPLEVTFEVTATDIDPGDTALTVAWDFGDGASDTGAQVKHTYNDAGTFTAKVTVADGNGGIDREKVVINVTSAGAGNPGGGLPPVDPGDVQPSFTVQRANGADLPEAKDDAGKPITDGNGNPVVVGVAPLEVILDGSGSKSPSDATFEWNFGDGKGSGPGPGATQRIVPHRYILFGEFQAKLTITAGTVTKSFTRTIRVTDGEPAGATSGAGFAVSLLATPRDGSAPLMVELTAQTAETVTRYEWNFGDGSPVLIGTAAKQSHAYARVGTYLASVVATNAAGERVESPAVTIVATDNPRGTAPTARLAAVPLIGPAPLQVQFSAQDSSDPDSDPLTFEWDFEWDFTGACDSDGFGDATGPTTTHVYSVPGTFTTAVRVTDSTGLCTIASSPPIVVEPSTVVPPSGGNAGGGGNTQPVPTPVVTCPMLSPLMMGLTLLGLFGIRMSHGRRQRP